MTLPATFDVGRIVDGEVDWQPASSPVGASAAVWPDPALSRWVRRRVRDQVPGPVAAVRTTDGGLWQIILPVAADGSVVTAEPWAPAVPDAPLTSTLLEATGFQVSHALRSPLSRLAGHHALATRELDRGDPDAAKRELQAAGRVVEEHLATADQLATALTALVALPRQARAHQDAPGLVSAARAALDGLDDTVAQPRLHLEVPGVGPDTATLATIEVAEPGAVPAASVAILAAYLRAAWVVEAVLVTHDHRLWRLCGPATGGARVRTIAAEDLSDQGFAVGRSISQGSGAGAVGFAVALAGLVQGGGEVTLSATRAEHRRLAALIALGETGGPVLLDADGRVVGS